MTRSRSTAIFFVTLVFALSLNSLSAQAQRANEQQQSKDIHWVEHQSVTESYDVYFPKDYAFKVFPFQFNKKDIAMSSEIIFPRPDEKDLYPDMTYLVKSEQTFGPALNQNEVDSVIAREASRYTANAETLNAQIISNTDVMLGGAKGKKIYLVYPDQQGANAMRVAFYATANSLITQLILGPQSDIFSYRADEFFNSISPKSTRLTQENPIGVGWVEHSSPSNIFSVTLPPIGTPYTPDKAEFVGKQNLDAMRVEIMDPMLKHTVKFLVYAYRTNKPITPQLAQQVFFTKHLEKYAKKVNTSSVPFQSAQYDDGAYVMRTKVQVPKQRNAPHINVLSTEIRIKGNDMLVAEFLSSERHEKSGLDKTLFSQIKFHPEKYAPK